MGDLLRSLQTTADGWRFIGGTPEKREVVMGVRVVKWLKKTGWASQFVFLGD